MNMKVLDADLILNNDGSVFHLHLRPEHIADTVIIVGDLNRVNEISKLFDLVEFRIENREFHTHTGRLNGKRLTVLSTGIGPDNIDIVMNELDAAVNMDLNSRKPKTERKKLSIIRLGTSGSMQRDIPVDSFVVSKYGLGLDGSLNFYADLDKVKDKALTAEFVSQTAWPVALPLPYVIPGTERLTDLLSKGQYTGITATAPGFYAPQGRIVRLELAFPELNDHLMNFEYQGLKVMNYEMETSSLYGLGHMLGHDVASVCVILANRIQGVYSKDYKKTVRQLITYVLEKLTS